MLITLLKEIHKNKISSFTDLCEQLEINEKFLKHLVFELVKNNYLEKLNSSNTQCHCNSKTCSKSMCDIKINSLNSYGLTEKGVKLLGITRV